MHRKKLALINIVLMMAVTVTLLEIGLRLAPQLIPLSLLQHFQKELRQEIASSRHLPNESVFRLIRRDDNGNPIRLPIGNATYFRPADHVDRELGAVENYVMDSNGFCNPLDASTRDTVDVLALGDSFTWCTAVSAADTWVAKLGLSLGLKVYNAGNPANGPDEYQQILKAVGLDMKPHTVIMNIYEGNDLRDAINHDKWRAKNLAVASPRITPKAQMMPPDVRQMPAAPPSLEGYPFWYKLLRRLYYGLIDAPVIRSSYSANLVISAAVQAFKKVQSPTVLKVNKNDPMIANIDYRFQVQLNGTQIVFNAGNTDNDEIIVARMALKDTGLFDLFKGALETFKDLSKEHEFNPIVIYTPTASTAYINNIVFSDEGLREDLISFSQYQRTYLSRQCAELGISYFDMTKVFQSAVERGELLYFPGNLHLRPEGHALVSNFISQVIPSTIH